jgi:DNA-binding beta-propeller fold protein YncE
MTSQSFRLKFIPIAFAAILLVPVSCGSERRTTDRDAAERNASTESTSAKESTPPEKPPPAPEPAEAPGSGTEPAGRIIDLGDSPEGIAADPETGLVAVALREPDELALVNGESGEILRRVELPESARHLSIAAPGGPVLVPAERSDSLVQVGLPDGEIESETPVGKFPHDAAAAPNGRVFVGNEFGNTASVIEDGRETEKIETSLQPGGIAVTGDGLVGIVGVRGLALEVFDSKTLEPLGRIDAGEGPTHVRAGPKNRFYVTDTRGDAVLVYAARPELEQLDRVPLSGSPYGIAIDPERNHLWVTLTGQDQVVQLAIEESTLREVARYPTVRQPNTVTVDTASGRVFVTGKANEQLQILEPR